MGSVKLKRGRQNVVPFCVVFLTHVVCFLIFCAINSFLQVFQALDGKNVWVIK